VKTDEMHGEVMGVVRELENKKREVGKSTPELSAAYSPANSLQIIDNLHAFDNRFDRQNEVIRLLMLSVAVLAGGVLLFLVGKFIHFCCRCRRDRQNQQWVLNGRSGNGDTGGGTPR